MGVSGKKIAGVCAGIVACVVAGLVAVSIAGTGAGTGAGASGSGAGAAASGARETNWVLADRSGSASSSGAGGADAGVATGGDVQTAYTADGAECVAGRVLVSFDGSMTEDELRTNLAAAGVDAQDVTLVSSALEGNDVLVAVDYAGDAAPDAVAASLAEQPYVTGAEPDIMFELAEADGYGEAGTGEAPSGAGGANAEAEAGGGEVAGGGATDVGGGVSSDSAEAAETAVASAVVGGASLAAEVNDPSFSEQWGFETVKATAAWDTAQAAGRVTVAVIDSGADCDHPDLAGNLVTEYAKDVITGKTGAEAVEDTIGHGTHVAGIISAVANNGVGVAGVSFNAQVLPVKATNDRGKLPTTALVAALDYIVKCKQDADSPDVLKNLRVVNMSLGYNDNPDSLREAIERAQDAGLLIVGAAGNKQSSTAYYPAAYDGVVGVSACKQSAGAEAGVEFDASYSNYGTYVDICAPGTDIYSTMPNGSYGLKNGTSMAAPLVAGAAALLFARNSGMEPSYAEKLLEETALDVGDAGWDARYGYGLLDVQSAVENASVAVEGADRYETAGAVARQAYPEGAAGVVVASGDNFPDALAAEGLAGLLDYPVVITQSASLTPSTARLIEDLGATELVIVGGHAAVSTAVEDELSERFGAQAVTRVWGDDRYATAAAVYDFGAARAAAGLCEPWGDTAIVASGANFPDALSISGYSFENHVPLFLAVNDGSTGGSYLPETEYAVLASGRFERIIVVGGSSAVTDGLEQWLGLQTAEYGNAVVRLDGADRYETSREIAEFVCAETGDAQGACIATGTNFPDALVGGVLAAKTDAVVLLADTGKYAAFDALRDRGDSARTLWYLGGTNAVPNVVRSTAEAAVWS